MKAIQIDKLLFISAICDMQKAADDVDITSKKWESMGEKSDVFDAYVEGFMQIQAIIKSYRELARKDIGSIKSLGDELEAMDLKLINFWK